MSPSSESSSTVAHAVMPLGRQLMADFYDCPADLLASPARIEVVMRGAAEACKATIVESVFHHFNPHGVSGAVIIAESHLAIHTWPEYGYAAVDVFTCGTQVQPAEAVAYLAEHLQAEASTTCVLARSFQTPTWGSRGIK